MEHYPNRGPPPQPPTDDLHAKRPPCLVAAAAPVSDHSVMEERCELAQGRLLDESILWEALDSLAAIVPFEQSTCLAVPGPWGRSAGSPQGVLAMEFLTSLARLPAWELQSTMTHRVQVDSKILLQTHPIYFTESKMQCRPFLLG